MQKTTAKFKQANGKYDLSNDLKNVKIALTNVTRDATGKASQAMHHSLDDLKKKSNYFQKSIHNYIKEQPVKSLGFAMLAGAIIGYFIRKK